MYPYHNIPIKMIPIKNERPSLLMPEYTMPMPVKCLPYARFLPFAISLFVSHESLPDLSYPSYATIYHTHPIQQERRTD